MKRLWIKVWAGIIALAFCQAHAITLTAFGPHGEGGAKNGQTFKIGTGGSVYELDGFLDVAGQDLNGIAPGGSAQLSRHGLPAGLVYAFSNQLSADHADVTLTYVFSNATASPFAKVRFAVLLDAEIDQESNTFFNEYGEMSGVAGQGSGDLSPDMWQIDEPGFQAGTLLRNLYMGSLNNSNAVPVSAPNDVALSLGFELGTLWPGSAVTVRVLVSEAGHSRGTMLLKHYDTDPASATVLTLSGEVEPLVTVVGLVFRDLNNNHAFDGGEGLGGAALYLDLNSDGVRQEAEPQSFTDANGRYSIGNLAAGSYTLRVDAGTLPAGLTNTVDPDGICDQLTVVASSAGQTLSFDWGYREIVPPAQFTNVTGQIEFAFLDWRLNRPRGSLIGTLRLTNPPTNTAAYGPPFHLGLRSDTNLFYVLPVGTNDLPYVDLTGAVTNQAGARLNPGQSVVVSNLVEVYSRDRSAPSAQLFELWANLIRLAGSQN